MKDDVTIVGSLRRSPVRVALFSFLPLVLAAVQLANAAATSMDLWISLAFAAAMVSYAIVYTRYLLAQDRLQVLESTASPSTAD